MGKVHLIMPMGGLGSRFSKDGYLVPKPLIEINGKPFFYWATRSIQKFVDIEDLTFVVLKEHVKNFHINEEILKYFKQSKIIVIENVLNGAVLTCKEGLKNIDDNLPVIFNDCDQMFMCQEFYQYCNSKEFDELDGILLTFKSNEAKYSFLELKDGYVVRTVEKEAISDSAICGCYYFKNKKIFLESLKEYLITCNYKEYFVSGLYNIMAKNNYKIKSMNVDMLVPFGTPKEYDEAIKSKQFERMM